MNMLVCACVYVLLYIGVCTSDVHVGVCTSDVHVYVGVCTSGVRRCVY